MKLAKPPCGVKGDEKSGATPPCPKCATSSASDASAHHVVRHGTSWRILRVFVAKQNGTRRFSFALARYKCRICRHVFRDKHPDELHRRWYSSSTIALGMTAFARGWTAQAVRRLFGFHDDVHVDTLNWEALSRWLSAFAATTLWPTQSYDSALSGKCVGTSRQLAIRAHDFLRSFSSACTSTLEDVTRWGVFAAQTWSPLANG